MALVFIKTMDDRWRKRFTCRKALPEAWIRWIRFANVKKQRGLSDG